jgi:biotin operon repressor
MSTTVLKEVERVKRIYGQHCDVASRPIKGKVQWWVTGLNGKVISGPSIDHLHDAIEADIAGKLVVPRLRVRRYNATELGKKLGYSRAAVRNWDKAGMPGEGPTGNRRYKLVDSQAWLAKYQAGGAHRRPHKMPRSVVHGGVRLVSSVVLAKELGTTKHSINRYVRDHGMPVALKQSSRRKWFDITICRDWLADYQGETKPRNIKTRVHRMREKLPAVRQARVIATRLSDKTQARIAALSRRLAPFELNVNKLLNDAVNAELDRLERNLSA